MKENKMEDQHIYHHSNETPTVYVKVEKNSKGYNWEVSVSNCKTIDEAVSLLKEAEAKLAKSFGELAI
jgi:hypothetical protein